MCSLTHISQHSFIGSNCKPFCTLRLRCKCFSFALGVDTILSKERSEGSLVVLLLFNFKDVSIVLFRPDLTIVVALNWNADLRPGRALLFASAPDVAAEKNLANRLEAIGVWPLERLERILSRLLERLPMLLPRLLARLLARLLPLCRPTALLGKKSECNFSNTEEAINGIGLLFGEDKGSGEAGHSVSFSSSSSFSCRRLWCCSLASPRRGPSKHIK